MSELSSKECTPCKSGTAPLKGSALNQWQDKLGGEWRVIDEHHLEREYRFDNFRQALAFTNRIGELAESNNHHPDIFLKSAL